MLFKKITVLAEELTHKLSRKVQPPVQVPCGESFVFRYKEQTIYQAIIQKLARVTSSLNATIILMENGYYQEQAVMHRVLDELNEDITFLCIGVIKNDIKDLHKKYLEAFWEEEFDQESSLKSTQKRPMVRREKIQAYINYQEEAGDDPSTGKEAARTVSKAYSGFVHAASPQVMEMYGGSPSNFHVRGMRGTPRELEYRDEIWNYYYRTLTSFALATKAFGDEGAFKACEALVVAMEESANKNYAYSSNKT